MMKWISKRKKAKEILEQLNSCADEFTFPMLDNGYVYLIDSRMTIFSSDVYWGITIEIIGFSPRGGGHNGINNAVHTFGNYPGCIPGLQNENFFYFTDDAPDQRAFDETYGFYINSNAKSILIDGIEYDLIHEKQKYWDADISINEGNPIGIQDYLRLIWPQIPTKPFLSTEKLLQITHHHLENRFQFDNWWHPDLIEGELPSETETFVKIAHAIASDNFTELSNLSHKSNNNWRNWPHGGTL